MTAPACWRSRAASRWRCACARRRSWKTSRARTFARSRSDEKPYWHVERARIEDTKTVPVELIVNGQVVATKIDRRRRQIRDLEFDYTPERSSWVALRIFPSSHTNPVFVEVDGQPIRASRKSAQWCLDAVDVCWKAKVKNIRAAEQPAAAEAFAKARQAYAKILSESKVD